MGGAPEAVLIVERGPEAPVFQVLCKGTIVACREKTGCLHAAYSKRDLPMQEKIVCLIHWQSHRKESSLRGALQSDAGREPALKVRSAHGDLAIEGKAHEGRTSSLL